MSNVASRCRMLPFDMLLFLSTCRTIFSSFRHIETNWTCSTSFDMSNERVTSCCRRSWFERFCRHVERSSIFISCLFVSLLFIYCSHDVVTLHSIKNLKWRAKWVIRRVRNLWTPLSRKIVCGERRRRNTASEMQGSKRPRRLARRYIAYIYISRSQQDARQLKSPVCSVCLGRGLPQCQVASWSIRPFGHNGHGPKSGGLLCMCPFWKGSWVSI